MKKLDPYALTALGFCLAWRMTSTQGFHAVMNLFLMPMWFLSGALFPVQNASAPLRAIMRLNPLTYGVAGLLHDLGKLTVLLADAKGVPLWWNSAFLAASGVPAPASAVVTEPAPKGIRALATSTEPTAWTRPGSGPVRMHRPSWTTSCPRKRSS